MFPEILATRPRVVSLNWSPYYPLNKDGIFLYAPLHPGVYKLGLRLGGGKIRVFYVGQTENLDSRLTDHAGIWETNDEIKAVVRKYYTSFSFAPVNRTDDRDAAERALYLRFKPVCNSQVPTGPAYIVSPLETKA